ncbi:hypothetical protein NL676_030581 [Syzygium grande]|nr:hypothetical protein NL676_030581 [Syzygium grande]
MLVQCSSYSMSKGKQKRYYQCSSIVQSNDDEPRVLFEKKATCHISKKFLRRFHNSIKECGHIDNKLEKLAVRASVEMTPAARPAVS